MWENAGKIYDYVDKKGIDVEDLDIQLHVYVFPMTKELLATCKENQYRFYVLNDGGALADAIMPHPHYDFSYTDIDSMEWVSNCTEESGFSVGTCASAGFNFSIFSEKYLDNGAVVNYEDISFKAAIVIPVYDFSYGNTLITQKQLGIFHVSDYDKEAGMINFTCMDNMRFLDKKAKKIKNFATVPIKTDALISVILLQSKLHGYNFSEEKPFQVNKVEHLKKLTYRTILSYALEPVAAYAYADYIGEITCKYFYASASPVATIPYDNVMNDKSSGPGVKINGYEIQYGDNMVSSFFYDAGEEHNNVPVPLTVDNPLFIKKKQDSLERIAERMNNRTLGFTFEPYEVTTFMPNFYIEAGDFVNVEDKNGVMHKILVSQLTWRDNLEMEIISACETGGDESSSYDSDVHEAIQRNGNIDTIPVDDDNEEDDDTKVYMPEYITGKYFNGRIKSLASGSYKEYDDWDEIITKIEVTDVKPGEGVTTQEFANTENGQVLTAYMDGTVVKLYTEADIIMLPEDSSYMFSTLKKLTTIDLSRFSAEQVTNMGSMFSTAQCLTMLNLGEYFDTSNVTNMKLMFADMGAAAEQFGAFSLELGDKFNTSKVTDMSSMFFGIAPWALSVTLKLGDKFDTSKVTNMSYMFYGSCMNAVNKFETDLANISLASATNLQEMFHYFGPNTYVSDGAGNRYELEEKIKIDLGENFIVTGSMSLGYYALAPQRGIILQVPQSTYDYAYNNVIGHKELLEVR